ncbi:MAG: response regulator [Mobilitalea sp.]
MLRLLLADDEYIERQAMQIVMKREFGSIYEIEVATNGVEVVEKAREFQPHLIFMDIKMPGRSGIEAAKIIKQYLPDTNIVFITAYDFFDYAKEAIELDAEAILLKPVEIETILELIKKVTIKIKNRLESCEKRRQIENKFEQITRQFHEEFIGMLGNFNTNPDQLGQYLKIMDVSFGCGVTAVIDISDINNDDSLSIFQKGIFKRRMIEKIEELCKKEKVILVTGLVGDAIKLLFVFPSEMKGSEKIEYQVDSFINRGLKVITRELPYGISDPVCQESLLPDAMYQASMKAFYLDEKKCDCYPYELEEKCIQAIQKLDVSEARLKIQEIACVLQREYHYKSAFNREVRGLYSVIKRTLRLKFRGSFSIFLQADERIGDVDNYSSMMSLFGIILDYLDSIADISRDKNQVLIQKICNYTEENYNKDISLEEAASYIGFSTYYFAKLFKEYQKTSYIDYMINLRVKKAKKLLDDTDMNIAEVGYTVGYEDANYFTRVFKKVEGLTPSIYKTRERVEDINNKIQ